MTNELLNGYSSPYKSPRAMLKINIRKAFDTVNWSAIMTILDRMEFAPQFSNWLYQCISIVRYTLVFNAYTVGYFKGSNDLRQGDSISAYLFIMIMETFTLAINKQVDLKNFALHPKCRKPMVTTLAFVDDLLILTKPIVMSLQSIMKTLSSFYNFSKLQTYRQKSHKLLAGLTNRQISVCLNITNMLPLDFDMAYLGIPLVTKRIIVARSLSLYKKVTAIMNRWESKYISQPGRLLIINAVILFMVVYWSRTFLQHPCEKGLI